MTSRLPRIAVSVKEAAQMLGVSTDHVHDLKNSGRLRWSKSGSRVLVEYASVVEHFEEGRQI